jgi:hypothetical protein
MAHRTKLGLAALAALGAVAATLVPLALGTSLAPTEVVAESPLKAVGGNGIRGQAFAHEFIEQESVRVHVTLACSAACPVAGTINGVPMRFTFAQRPCGKQPGKTFVIGSGQLGAGGLDVKRERGFDPGKDPIRHSGSVRADWDIDGDGKLEPAACGRNRVVQDTSNP